MHMIVYLIYSKKMPQTVLLVKHILLVLYLLLYKAQYISRDTTSIDQSASEQELYQNQVEWA